MLPPLGCRLKDTDLAGEEEASFARLDKDGNGSLSVADLKQVAVLSSAPGVPIP